MDKEAFLRSIIHRLNEEIEKAVKLATETAESATDDESRSEGKYDTRGLEASYVASAQANFVKDLRQSLQAFTNLKLRPFASGEPIALSALVTTLSSAGREQYFIAPAHGGTDIETPEGVVTLISPQSPLGADLIGKTAGAKITAAGGKSILKVE